MPCHHKPTVFESDVGSVLEGATDFHPFRTILGKELTEESIFLWCEWIEAVRRT
jgi:hypothetical protein